VSGRGRQRVVLDPVQLDVDDGKGSDGAPEQQRPAHGGRSGVSDGRCSDRTRRRWRSPSRGDDNGTRRLHDGSCGALARDGPVVMRRRGWTEHVMGKKKMCDDGLLQEKRRWPDSGVVRRMLLGPAWEHSAQMVNKRLPHPGLLHRGEEAAPGEVSGRRMQEEAATCRRVWSHHGCFGGGAQGNAISMEDWRMVKKIRMEQWCSGMQHLNAAAAATRMTSGPHASGDFEFK
jgi:hypothetical protein